MGSFWFNFVLIVHVLVGISVIVFVLLQHGKGADMGASFGGGSAGSLFGSSGSANFLSRTTAALATLFFITSMSLTYFAGATPRSGRSVVDSMTTEQSAPQSTPVAPAQESSAPQIPR